MREKRPKLRTPFTDEKATPASSLNVDDREKWNFDGKTWEVNILQPVS